MATCFLRSVWELREVLRADWYLAILENKPELQQDWAPLALRAVRKILEMDERSVPVIRLQKEDGLRLSHVPQQMMRPSLVSMPNSIKCSKASTRPLSDRNPLRRIPDHPPV